MISNLVQVFGYWDLDWNWLMFCQVGLLVFDLGERHADIVIRDVQLWSKDAVKDSDSVSVVKGRFLQYVALDMLPLWLESEELYCYTSSKITVSYFNSKLTNSKKGIVICTTNDNNFANVKNEFYVLYRIDNSVRCFRFNYDLKQRIDSMIHNERRDSSSKNKNIDDIIRKSQIRLKVANTKVTKNVQINDKKLQFNETLSRLILGGLRLRGIPNTQVAFQKLYKMTFEAAEFTHRNDLQLLANGSTTEIPFETLQETVEILLKLFTKS